MSSFFLGGCIGLTIIMLFAAISLRMDVMIRVAVVMLLHIVMCMAFGW